MKQVIQENWVPVVKAEQLTKLMDTEEYCNTQRQQADADLKAVHLQIDQLKKEVYEEVSVKLNQENQLHLTQLEQNLTAMLDKVTDDIWHIVYKVLSKLGISKYEPQFLTGLIKQELSELVEVKLISISANTATINELTNCLALEYHDTFRLNHELVDGECMLETNLYVFRLKVAEAIEKLNNLSAWKN